jgi:serine/threonine-protein kinase HipA
MPARAARTIYDEVEAATLGGWAAAAAYAGVPGKIAGIWEKEMIQQTKPLREDARRSVATAKARSATPKRSPKK